MPFLTDKAWPAGLLTIFESCGSNKRETVENRLYGPYDKLLNYCFGSDFSFYLTRQTSPIESRDPDFVDFFVVSDSKNKPVLIVEVKEDKWVHRANKRYNADNQMRQRYDELLGDCSTPRLWGLGFFGTSMRVYCGDKETHTMTPASIPRPTSLDRILPADFLDKQWDLDLLSNEGFNKMKEIVTDIITNHH